MKKGFIQKMICLVMAIATMVGVAAMPAYAAGNDEIGYGQVVDILRDVDGHSFTFTTSNTTPFKRVDDDARTHRIIFKVGAQIADMDYFRATFRIGIKPEGSNVTYYSDYEILNYWDVHVFTNNPAESDTDGYMDVYVPISPGQRFQVIFETHDNRQIKISQFDLYCD